MKLVKESLNFERGQSPKASMGIGEEAVLKKYYEDNFFYKISHNLYKFIN